MTHQTTLTFIVPVLVLITLKTSDINREMDLQNPAWQIVPFIGESSGGLGRFVMIHTVNYLVISICFILGLYTNLSLLLTWGVLAILALIWLTLPVLEVKEYDQISANLESGTIPDSAKYHMSRTVILIIFLIATRYIEEISVGLPKVVIQLATIFFGFSIPVYYLNVADTFMFKLMLELKGVKDD